MSKQKNKKKGVSLIVLIITIIVMIILATAVIISLNNSNIIDNAVQAVDETDLKNVQTIASLAWGEAYINGNQTETELKTAVNNALTANKVDLSKYTIIVTKNGVNVTDKNRAGWTYKKDQNDRNIIVTNGKVDLKIGSSITYEPTGDASSYTGGWQVLGAEDGKLLILSKLQVGTKELYGRDGYKNAISYLDAVCAPFNTGKSAVSARSINVDDVNKITGYNPNNIGVYDPEQTGSGTKYGVGKIYEYGNEVTYTSDGTNWPQYASSNGNNGLYGANHSLGFYYYDKTASEWQTYRMSEIGKITTLTNDGYRYYPITLTSTYGTTGKGISATSKEYKMLFADTGTDMLYWLASPCVSAGESSISFEVLYVSGNNTYYFGLTSSQDVEYSSTYGVRAVVSLAPNINVTGSNEAGWSY